MKNTTEDLSSTSNNVLKSSQLAYSIFPNYERWKEVGGNGAFVVVGEWNREFGRRQASGGSDENFTSAFFFLRSPL